MTILFLFSYIVCYFLEYASVYFSAVLLRSYNCCWY